MRGVENKVGGGGVSVVNRMRTYDRLVLVCKIRKCASAIYVTVLSDYCALYIQLYGDVRSFHGSIGVREPVCERDLVIIWFSFVIPGYGVYTINRLTVVHLVLKLHGYSFFSSRKIETPLLCTVATTSYYLWTSFRVSSRGTVRVRGC